MTPEGSGTNGTRRDLLQRYQRAIARVHGARIAREALADRTGRYALVALGKAAAAFAEGAARIDGLTLTHSFTAGPRGYGDTHHPGGHPYPDQASLDAGDALAAWLAALPPALPLLAFVSGGASTCIERLRPGWTLDQVAARTRELVVSGATIGEINAERAQWSLLKHGGALALAGDRPVEAFVMSDVPDDDPAVVGSGPFLGAPTRVVATNGDALAAVAADHAPRRLTGDAAAQGRAVAEFLRSAAPGLHAWGGETTVALPASPGRGGRCQQLALAAAIALEGTRPVAVNKPVKIRGRDEPILIVDDEPM